MLGKYSASLEADGCCSSLVEETLSSLSAGEIEKTTLDWNPQGHRRRSRLKRTWQRTIEDEIRSTRRLWNEVKGKAGDHNA